MSYNYDYFISYAHADNCATTSQPGFVDVFVQKLKSSVEHQQLFGGEVDVFYDKSEIRSMSDWDMQIRSALASSRFFIALLSPNYFKSEYCANEFYWWMQHEMHRRVLSEGVAPMIIVNVGKLYDYSEDVLPDIPKNLQFRFPNWISQIRKIQCGPEFDMHDLYRAKIDDALLALSKEVKDKVYRQNRGDSSPSNSGYPRYNNNFVGRRDNLLSLREALSLNPVSAIIAVNGFGGIGKTELALTYGHAFSWDYELGRVFAKCENQTSIYQVLLTSGIAEMHNLELPKGTEEQQLTFLFSKLKEKRKQIIERNRKENTLERRGSNLLLILDNVNKDELIKRRTLDLLPDFFHVIITTRMSSNLFRHVHSESVDRLSESESLELLGNLRSFGDDPNEILAARQIVKLLDGFTLAVELVGAYLSLKPFITYQKKYERLLVDYNNTINEIVEKADDLTRHHAGRISVFLKSTFEELSDNAINTMRFASMMDPDAVALPWIQDLLELSENDWNETLSELKGFNLLIPLKRYNNIARIHRLVAQYVQNYYMNHQLREIGIKKIRNKVENNLLATEDLIIVKRLIKDQAFWCRQENAWQLPIILQFYQKVKSEWTPESEECECDWNLSNVFKLLGGMFESCGDFNNAQCAYKEFHDICSYRLRIIDSVSVINEYCVSCILTGFINQEVGDIEMARELYLTSMNESRNILLNDYNNVGTLRNLCDSYSKLGDLECIGGNVSNAIEFYQKSIQTLNRLLVVLPEGSLISNIAQGCYYEMLGDVSQLSHEDSAHVEIYYKKALFIVKTLAQFRPNDIAIQEGEAFFLQELMRQEVNAGNMEQAKAYCLESMETIQRLAANMQENIQIMRLSYVANYNMGLLIQLSGDGQLAKIYFERALEICEKNAEKCPSSPRYSQDRKDVFAAIEQLERNIVNDKLELKIAGSWFGWLFGRK